MIPTQTLIPIAAIIFTLIGILLLLGIPKKRHSKIFGALNLVAGIVLFAYYLTFQVQWKPSYDDNVPKEQVSKVEKQIVEKKQVNPATKKLLALSKTFPKAGGNERRRLIKETSKLVKDGSDVNITDENGNTPLQFAIPKEHIEIVKVLIDAGADVNAADSDGDIPLCQAARIGLAKIAKMLIVAGADVNKRGRYGQSPLWCASNKGKTEIVRLLISAKADINSTNPMNATPLNVASSYGHTEVVKLLLAAGAELEIADHDDGASQGNGCTALISAAAQGHAEVVNLLIKAKANVNAVNEDGETAMSYADGAGYKKIVKILKAHGAKR